jgi:hypothetical protein
MKKYLFFEFQPFQINTFPAVQIHDSETKGLKWRQEKPSAGIILRTE